MQDVSDTGQTAMLFKAFSYKRFDNLSVFHYIAPLTLSSSAASQNVNIGYGAATSDQVSAKEFSALLVPVDKTLAGSCGLPL